MKTIQILILLFVINSYSQQEINFKMEYQPNLTYEQTTVTEISSKTMYLAAPEILNRLKDNGVENPQIMEKTTIMKNTNKTGKLKKNRFSLTCEYIQSPDINAIPNGTKIFGNVQLGRKPEFESIYSPTMDKETKKMLFTTISSMIGQLTFPEKKMKIGDTFLREMPLTIPIGSKAIKMENTIIYKLIKIENGLAYFDIVQDYTFDTSANEMDFFASGKGTGTLIYDIKHTYYLTYKLESDLHYEINHENLKAVAKSKTTFEQRTVISDNN